MLFLFSVLFYFLCHFLGLESFPTPQTQEQLECVHSPDIFQFKSQEGAADIPHSVELNWIKQVFGTMEVQDHVYIFLQLVDLLV